MKVKLITDLRGLVAGVRAHGFGHVLEVADIEGKHLIEAGHAEPVAEAPAEKRETAEAPAPEKRATTKK